MMLACGIQKITWFHFGRSETNSIIPHLHTFQSGQEELLTHPVKLIFAQERTAVISNLSTSLVLVNLGSLD